MDVSALFFPSELAVAPGDTAAFTLQLQNTTDEEQQVTLVVEGDLADHTVIQSEKIHLAPNERFEVPVLVDPGAGVSAGPHECRVEVLSAASSITAVAVVDVSPTTAFNARLEPARSRSARAGRHKVAIENAGNTPVLVELLTRAEADVATELAAPSVTVEPGTTARVELRLTPHQTKWSGDPSTHPFAVDVVGSNGEQFALDGAYEQTTRVKPWFPPALAGMLGALVVGALAWFLLLRPAVESIAQDEATELDTAQQAELDLRVAEIEAAAEEASELPLGEPTDLRLFVTAAPGAEATEAFDFDRAGNGRTLAISDVIFQNPTGAVGTVEFLRDDDVLLVQEMANFRDLDFHLVAPFRVSSGSSIGLRVVCATPGPTMGECEVSATVVGFVDDAP
ncbi:MAG: FixG Ig-like domain-containing protein [Actinomycetota bacterium]